MEKPTQERKLISTRHLKDLAIYLSGIRDGRGNILPLGIGIIDELWDTISYLEGDTRFKAERDRLLK